MTSLIVKQPNKASDTQTFRAYRNVPRMSDRKASLGISASTTGNVEFGARRCAAKAFIQFNKVEAFSEPDEIETRILLTSQAPGVWLAILQPKKTAPEQKA